MKLLNPRLTVENTDSRLWIVRMEHRLDEHTYMDLQLTVPKTDASLPTLQGQVLDHAIQILTTMRSSLGT